MAAPAKPATVDATVDVESGVPSDVLRAPLEVRLCLVPELMTTTTTTKGWTVVDGFHDFDDIDSVVPWPADPAWAEAERMLDVTTLVCAVALSAAWCLLLLTTLCNVLGTGNNLWS